MIYLLSARAREDTVRVTIDANVSSVGTHLDANW